MSLNPHNGSLSKQLLCEGNNTVSQFTNQVRGILQSQLFKLTIQTNTVLVRIHEIHIQNSCINHIINHKS